MQFLPRQLGSAEDEADLRAVPVGDNDVVSGLDDVRDVMAGVARERPVGVGRPLISGPRSYRLWATASRGATGRGMVRTDRNLRRS